MLPVLVTVGIVLLLVFKGWSASKASQKRKEGFEKSAGELSLPFSRTVPFEQVEQLVQFPLMQRGSNKEFTNAIVAETDQLRLVLLDHKYVVGSGKNRATHRQTAAWVASNHLNMPSFNLYPESWYHRIGDLVMKKDIDFDDDPQFSHKFVLTGSDTASIREFFDVKRRQLLLKLNLPNVEAVRHGFIFYRPGRLIDPSELKSLMNEAFSLYQAFAPEQSVE